MGISSVCWDEKGRCLTNFRGGDLELMDFGGSMDDSVPTLELEVRAGIQTGWVGWGAQPAGALALFSWSLGSCFPCWATGSLGFLFDFSLLGVGCFGISQGWTCPPT